MDLEGAGKAETNRVKRARGIDGWIDGAGWLDGPAEFVQGAILGFYKNLGGPGQLLKDLLHGTKPLGHPLHPALTDVPLGAFSVMFIADWIALFTPSVPTIVGKLSLIVGIFGMVGAALSGYTDYTGTFGRERRYATTHGLVMSLSLVAMIVSLVLRQVNLTLPAMVVSSLAFLVILFGAYLGGHLSFGFGTMVNRNAFVEGVSEWTAVGRSADFADGSQVRVKAGDMPVMIVRRGNRLDAISAVCSHAGGPLDEGELDGDIVTCPWHGSRFCITDGRVQDGPATFDQPAFLVRESGDQVEVKLPAPLH